MKKKIILLFGLLFLLCAPSYAQIVTDGITKDPGGSGGGGGLTSADINTLTKLNNIITPDVLGTNSDQAIDNKLIDCNGNTCKPLRGEDCTTFDAATGGQYCIDTDDLIVYFCSVGEEDPCDDPEEWVAVSSAASLAGLSDVLIDTPSNGQTLVYNDFDNRWTNSVISIPNSICDLDDDVDCTGAENGHILGFNGSIWFGRYLQAGDIPALDYLADTGDLDASEFCIWSGSVVDCNIPLASLANLNTLLTSTLKETGTLTNGRLCTWDNAGDELDCDTVDDDVPDAADYTNLTGGTGITNNPTGTINVDSSEAGFLAAGALTCGAGTAGKAQIHTTPLQYCDNTATPVLRYSAYGDTSGNALTGDSAASFFSTGELEDDRVVNTITASNYCLLSGCALTGASSITGNFTLGATALLQWGSSGVSSPDVFFARDAAGVLKVYGAEAGNSSLGIYADEGDDNADKWKFTAHTDGHFGIYQNATEVLSLSSTGVIGIATIPGTLVSFTPAGSIAATNVQAAIEEAASEAGGGSGDITAVGSCTTGSCATEGGNDLFPFIYEGTADTFETTFSVTDPTTPDKAIVFPNLSGTVALNANKLDFFAATTSAEIKGVISDETGSGGALVFATSPTLTTPTLGVASATSINKVAITAPATGSTLTIADGKTLTVSNTMSFDSAGDSGVFTMPNATATLVGRDTTDTLTNKTISGSSNTLSNIPWSALVNVPAFRKTLVQLRPQDNEPPASSFATFFPRNGHPGLTFNGDVCAIWSFVMPNTYGGNGVTIDIWTVSSATSGDLDWDGSWERIATTQDIDADSFATAISADNNNNNATSGIPTKVSIAFTDGAQMDSCAADELCRFRLCRDATGDTTATTSGAAVLIGGQIKETP